MSGIKGSCGGQKIYYQEPCKNPCQRVVVCKDPCQGPCKPHHHHRGNIYVHQQAPGNSCNPCVVSCCPKPCDPCQGQGRFCCDK